MPPPRCSTAIGVAWSEPGRGGACCGALHVHAGLTDETQRAGARGHRVDAGRRADRRQLGRLRRGAEGLRAPARHTASGGVLGACARRPRVRGRAHRRPAASSPAATGHRAGPVPPPPRAAQPPGRAHRAGSGVRRGRARRRRPVLWCGRRLLGARSRSWPARSASASSTASSGRPLCQARRVVASANPGCAMHLQACGVDVRHPIELVAEALS